MQVCKFIFMHVCKYANASMKVCNYANMQVWMYVSVQCKYASVHENMQESIQIWKYEKYAGM